MARSSTVTAHMSNPTADTSLATSPNPADERREQLAVLIIAALKRALGDEAVLESGERYAPYMDLQCRDAGIKFTCL
jgi:hypothetical protein